MLFYPPPYAPCQVLFLFFGGNVANLLFLRYKLRSTTLLKSWSANCFNTGCIKILISRDTDLSFWDVFFLAKSRGFTLHEPRHAYATGFGVRHCTTASFENRPSGWLIPPHSPGFDERYHTVLMQLPAYLVIVLHLLDHPQTIRLGEFVKTSPSNWL